MSDSEDLSPEEFAKERQAAAAKVKRGPAICRIVKHADGAIEKTELISQAKKVEPGEMSKEEVTTFVDSQNVNLGKSEPGKTDKFKQIIGDSQRMKEAMERVKAAIASRGGSGTSISLDTFEKGRDFAEEKRSGKTHPEPLEIEEIDKMEESPLDSLKAGGNMFDVLKAEEKREKDRQEAAKRPSVPPIVVTKTEQKAIPVPSEGDSSVRPDKLLTYSPD